MSTYPAQTRKPASAIDRRDIPPFMANRDGIGKEVAAAWAVVAGFFLLLLILF